MTEFSTWRSLVDGAEISALPDTGVAYYDVTIEQPAENEDTIWQDQFDDGLDLEGPTASFDPDAINGNGGIPITNGDHELINNSSEYNIEQPYTLYFVVDLNDADSRQALFNNLSDNVPSLEARFSDDEWLMHAGNALGLTPVEVGPQVVTAVFDGPDSRFRINGNSLSDDIDPSTDGFAGVLIGNDDANERPLAGDIGLFHPVNDAESLSTIESRESTLSDKFDISLS